MEINHPTPKQPLSPQEELALQHFREQIHQQVLHGGLSVDSVRNIVRTLKKHPDYSQEILAAIDEEIREMRNVAPGINVFALD
jgi:hypothetical protein